MHTTANFRNSPKSVTLSVGLYDIGLRRIRRHEAPAEILKCLPICARISSIPTGLAVGVACELAGNEHDLAGAAGPYGPQICDGPAGNAHGQSRAFATPIVSPHHAAAVTSKE